MFQLRWLAFQPQPLRRLSRRHAFRFHSQPRTMQPAPLLHSSRISRSFFIAWHDFQRYRSATNGTADNIFQFHHGCRYAVFCFTIAVLISRPPRRSRYAAVIDCRPYATAIACFSISAGIAIVRQPARQPAGRHVARLQTDLLKNASLGFFSADRAAALGLYRAVAHMSKARATMRRRHQDAVTAVSHVSLFMIKGDTDMAPSYAMNVSSHLPI